MVKFASNKRDAAEQLLGFYDAALGFLRSHGALLNAVKPEMLLDSEDFGRCVMCECIELYWMNPLACMLKKHVHPHNQYFTSAHHVCCTAASAMPPPISPQSSRVLNARATRAEASANPSEGLEAVEAWADVEENFADVSAAAWNTVVAQVFRVFVLGRVTTRALQGLPGAGGSQGPILPPESQLVGSNVFSVAECCLLAWASAHYALLFGPKAKRLTNFDVDFVDGLALFSLLAGHWPAFSSKRVSVHTGECWRAFEHMCGHVCVHALRDMECQTCQPPGLLDSLHSPTSLLPHVHGVELARVVCVARWGEGRGDA